MTTGGPDGWGGRPGPDRPRRTELCRDDAAYVLGVLSVADRRAYEEHLRDCAVCQVSVRGLAGLPGLLALTSEDVIAGADEPVPPSVLPGLLRRVRRTRRRRWLVGASAAAAAAIAVLLLWIIARPAPSETAGGPAGSSAASAGPVSGSPPSAGLPPDETVPMDQVRPGPMTATLELADRRWGTAITVVCSYDADMNRSAAYDLAIVDTEGHESSAGSWSGVPGVTARIPVATAVAREHISAFEIRLPDGRTILRGAP